MSETAKDGANLPKKTRLGRGLGSLLGGSAPQSSLMSGLDFQLEKETILETPQIPQEMTSQAISEAQKQVIEESKVVVSTPIKTESVTISPTHVSSQVNTHGSDAVASSNESDKVLSKSDVSSQTTQGTIQDSQRIWSMDIHKIRPNAGQPRRHFDKTQLEELAQSIREKGILQPITVRRAGSYFEIVAGERRWRASQIAGLHEVPAIVRDFNDQDTLELALIENIQRADLNAIDEAKAYQVLADRFQLTQAEIAQKVGKDRTTVTNALRLLSLAPQVQEMVSQGQLSMGHARALLAIEDSQEQVRCARLAAQKGLSVRQVEKLAKGESLPEVTTNEPDPREALAEKLISQIQDELQKLLATKVVIDYRAGKGKINLHFHSEEEFNGLVDIIRLTWQK